MPRKSPDEQLLLLITLKCKHGCPDCIYAEILGDKHIPMGIFRSRILPHVTEYHQITIAGGEPTLHPDFWNIVQMLAARKPEHLQIITNGVGFSNRAKQARNFLYALDSISGKTGTHIILRVSVDDYHAARLKGKAAELTERVKRVIAAEKGLQHLNLMFCAGRAPGQTMESLAKKYGLPMEKTISMSWKAGTGKPGGTMQKVVIEPSGEVFPTEEAMLKGRPIGNLRKERLPRILRRRHFPK